MYGGGGNRCTHQVSTPTSCSYLGSIGLTYLATLLPAQYRAMPLARAESPCVEDVLWKSSALTIVLLLGDALDTLRPIVSQRRPECTTGKVPVDGFVLYSVTGVPTSQSLPQQTLTLATCLLLVVVR